VRNPGPGIPAQHLPHLFERFYRVDPGRARADGGTGLGLAIVRSIMSLHRGSVEVSSEPAGPTEFRLRFQAAGG
jgi:two-component system heavy metal sensor histidine kinase CusS